MRKGLDLSLSKLSALLRVPDSFDRKGFHHPLQNLSYRFSHHPPYNKSNPSAIKHLVPNALPPPIPISTPALPLPILPLPIRRFTPLRRLASPLRRLAPSTCTTGMPRRPPPRHLLLVLIGLGVIPLVRLWIPPSLFGKLGRLALLLAAPLRGLGPFVSPFRRLPSSTSCWLISGPSRLNL